MIARTMGCLRIVAALMGGGLLLSAHPGTGDDVPFPEKYGVGAVFVQSDSASRVVVRECIPNGPASRGGLAAGDSIVALDGIATPGWPLAEVLAYLVKEKPSPCVITVHRGAQELSLFVQRERFSDIYAAADLELVLTADSTTYQVTPLHGLSPVDEGGVIRSLDVTDSQCNAVEVECGSVLTLVYFWASWCPPCKTLMSALRELQSEGGLPPMRIVSINVDRECALAAKFMDSLAPPGEQYWGKGYLGPASQVFQAHRRGFPTGALIGEGGIVLKITAGTDSILAMVRQTEAGSGGP